MHVAVVFILLISFTTAFKLEKEHPLFEDEPDELDEPEQRIEQKEDEDGSMVIDEFMFHCPDKHTFANLPNWFSRANYGISPMLGHTATAYKPVRLKTHPTVNKISLPIIKAP